MNPPPHRAGQSLAVADEQATDVIANDIDRDIDRTQPGWLLQSVLQLEPELRGWLLRHLMQGLEVDDVIQETYAILSGLQDTTHIQQPRAYVYATVRSLLQQHLRRGRVVSFENVAEIERLDLPHDERSPERHAIADQELRMIGASIAALPPRCREVFVMRKVEGLSQREIATRMGISENTVEKHIVKGLRLIMQQRAQRRPACALAGATHA